MIRLAAVADVHLGAGSAGTVRPALAGLPEHADVLLVAGDLTETGTPTEARVAAEELRDLGVPVVAVLGNHDHHAGAVEEVREILRTAGLAVLEGEGIVLDVAGVRLGVAGVKGFGGGFRGASAAEFGEPEMKAFVRHAKERATALRAALADLPATDVRVALTHYAPTADTLRGEARELYPFLGSHRLGDAVDTAGANLVVHGHAHAGTETGATRGGIPVRNVAVPVLRAPYTVLTLDASTGALS
ncbi:MAG TPA: metallophosphoesterase [Mycobacteriales bacterium]|nr:metallophosphoesterase [Mycobacteriales bacterium]